MNYMHGDSVVHLNVGGVKFTTSKSTLTWIPDSFFNSLLSGRIPTLRDETGAIFIDRDPRAFEVILNYLRTKQVDLSKVDVESLKHEAQYYGISPLVKRLLLCDELEQCPCGDVFFHGYLPPPPFPTVSARNTPSVSKKSVNLQPPLAYHSRNLSEPPILPSFNNAGAAASRQNGSTMARPLPSMEAKFQVPAVSHNTNNSQQSNTPTANHKVAAATTAEAVSSSGISKPAGAGHNRANSADFKQWKTHRSRGSADLTRQIKQELLATLKHQQDVFVDPHRVKMIRAHHSWIAVAYHHYIACYRMKDSTGWYLAYMSARLEPGVEQIALNGKPGGSQSEKLLATALTDQTICLWSIGDEGVASQIGLFSLSVPVDALFFIGGQLVALSKTGQVGIWHGMTQNWQVQDVLPISSYDTAGSFLLLGCTNGSIYYIDMQKFPLRMKDNDLLVTELYRDPSMDPITSISVYLTPKSSLCGNWIEIAYGTNAGSVRVIVQHPETVGHGPQLFQTFSVHRAPITKVALTTNHLISVCSEYNHVRSWMVTRFRGMISTQPGSTPLASFKVLTLESADNPLDMNTAGDVGPFGDQDGEQVFIQKLVPETNQLFVRLASNGERVCVVKSVDDSSIACFLVHECEGSSRMGARPRRFLFTGHVNGSIQMWDLTTALDIHTTSKEKPHDHKVLQGPTANELLKLIDECEITCNSMSSTPIVTPASSTMHIPSLFNNPSTSASSGQSVSSNNSNNASGFGRFAGGAGRNFGGKNCD